ncbi:putative plasma membrane g-protein coupled receptor [Rosellinia necatrix]|uniref:Putative plasma membrane g-protein coupled receptor n=1 Tax=Rosellinia necatrix TaxID=77044 RepID=A0A1S7UIG7_ROSNE|nr:putative plasma membrane g-protein coupled receptor [Rosellinia necatrix]
MAPLQRRMVVEATRFVSTAYRAFMTRRDNTQVIDPTDSETLVIMCVSISFAIVSVIAALFAFYWFVRMRRGFRQDMIMLLIQSDMVKSLWLILSPLFYFIVKKPFSSNRAFCQVSGFLLTAAIEASDIAVLLIAIHTALFIVKRQHPGVALGLQPYRRIAYTLWAVVPLIMAAIVPITGSSFVDNGSHCYLPIQPRWYRNALSWVPRYIIFGFIIITYTWLYVYVYLHFRRFGEDQKRAGSNTSKSTVSSTRRQIQRRLKSGSVSPTPPLITHNHFNFPHSPQDAMSKNAASKLRQYSVASTVSTLHIGEGVCLPAAPERAARKSSISWNLVDFDGTGTSASATPHVDTVPASPTIGPFTPPSNDINNAGNELAHADAITISTPGPTHPADGRDRSQHVLPDTQHNPWKRRRRILLSHYSETGSRNSLPNILATLRPGPSTTGLVNEEPVGTEYSGSMSCVRLSTEVSEEVMRRSRGRMQRQMRLLFVYPVIYMFTWIAPFVAHVYQYDAAYAASQASGNLTAAAYFDSASNNASTGHYNSAHILLSTIASASQSQIRFAPPAPAPTVVPLALRVVSTASLCIGAAVDCGFFSAWERPWRHLRGGFWENLAMRLRVDRFCGVSADERTGWPGRTRDERVADARAARKRRDKEREMVLLSKTAAAAASRSASSAGGPSSGGGGGGGSGCCDIGGESVVIEVGAPRERREWWDVWDESDSE